MNKCIRKGLIPLKVAFRTQQKRKYFGVWLNVGSHRQKVIKRSPICVGCGLVVSFAAVERWKKQKDAWHVNYYGVDDAGNEVLFTKDHIIPVAKGGKNSLDNLQTMCYVCNQKKGDSYEICNKSNT